jgi:hypothetical protein
MNKICAFSLIIITFVSLVLLIIPLVFISTYVFTGCSKESFIAILQLIPANRFWMIGLPIFLMCYVCAFYLLCKFFKLGATNPELYRFKVKEVYRLEDSDISEKLSELMSNTKTKKKLNAI